MDYHKTLAELQEMYSSMRMYSYMFYAQPGVRDMAILEDGIKLLLDNEKLSLAFNIVIDEINEEAARAYNVNRGWLIRFAFPISEGLPNDDFWTDFISSGLRQLRVEHRFLSAEQIDNRWSKENV